MTKRTKSTKPVAIRHFIDLAPIPARDLEKMITKAIALKKARGKKQPQPLAGKKLAMIFEKNSTRTRVSFEVAMHELGGYALYLNGNDLQIGRGETIADTARVLSRYVDSILLRGNSHEGLLELAAHADVPVINALTNMSHPCQIMADVMTVVEHLGSLKNKTIAWVGDGNNVANSWIEAAVKFGCTLKLACPKELRPADSYLQWAKANKGRVEVIESPEEAVKGAHAVLTDTWVSMGDKDADRRIKLLTPYQVDGALMNRAHKDAIFMHCLPAHRGEEVTKAVIDGPRSVIWDEAENRLHAQKAVLLWCFGKL